MRHAALVLTAAAALVAAGTAGAQTVGIGTSTPGSFYHSMGSAIAKVVSTKAGVQARVQPFSSAGVYFPAVNGGDLEYGLGNIYELYLAMKGEAHFKGRPNPNLRLISLTSPLRVAIFVKKDSPIKSIADLKGKRVPYGYNQQKIIIPLMAAEFATAGITSKDIVPVPVPNVARGADDFVAGRADSLFFALGSGKVAEADAAVGGIRALDIPNTPQNLAAVRKHIPVAYLRLEKPSKRLAGVVGPTHVIAYDAIFMTNAKQGEDEVYRITKAMWEHEDELKKSYAGFALFGTATMAKKAPAPIQYHPGAIRLYKEKGVWPPKE